MTVIFSLNKAEARVREDDYFQTPSGRRQRRINWAIFGLSAISCVAGILFAFGLPLAMSVRAVFILLLVASTLSTFSSAFFRNYRGAMRMRVRVTVGEEGLAVTANQHPENVTEWSNVVGHEIDEFFVRLRIAAEGKKRNGEATFYIPRRAFADEREMYAFLALIDYYRGMTNAQNATVAVPAARAGAWYQSRTGVDTGQETENAAICEALTHKSG